MAESQRRFVTFLEPDAARRVVEMFRAEGLSTAAGMRRLVLQALREQDQRNSATFRAHFPGAVEQ